MTQTTSVKRIAFILEHASNSEKSKAELLSELDYEITLLVKEWQHRQQVPVIKEHWDRTSVMNFRNNIINEFLGITDRDISGVKQP